MPQVRVYPPGYGSSPLSSDYRPWEADQTFLAAWNRVRNATLLDLSRLYELWELTEQACKVPGAFLEVGTWRGGSAGLMGLRLRALSNERLLVVADTFAGVAKAGERDPYYTGGEHSDTSREGVRQFLDGLSVTNTVLLQGIFPDDTAASIAQEEFALCHIDVDVYESARSVFEWVFPRLSSGGIVVFDDYGFYGTEGVTAFVHELRGRPGLVVVANANGHAIVVKQ